MKLDKAAEQAVRELGDAINAAVEKSVRVAEAIEALREIGYEPNLSLKLEIGLLEMGSNGVDDDVSEEIELDLTDEDVRTLQRMKIKF